METNELLIDAFTRIKEIVHSVADGLSDEQLAFRPAPDANSIAWLLWHISRVQDAQIAPVAQQSEVWTDGWYEKFQLPFDESETGYAQTSEQVGQVRASVALLVGYHDAVYERTVAFLQSAGAKDYGKIVDKNWNPPVTLGVRLVSIISDDLQHCGQAAYIKGLLPS